MNNKYIPGLSEHKVTQGMIQGLSFTKVSSQIYETLLGSKKRKMPGCVIKTLLLFITVIKTDLALCMIHTKKKNYSQIEL